MAYREEKNMKQALLYIVVAVITIAGIVTIAFGPDFIRSSSQSTILMSTNLLLVGVTAIYVIITGRLLRNADKQLLYAFKPSLLIHFETYMFSYYSENGDMNISFNYRITNPGLQVAFKILLKLDFLFENHGMAAQNWIISQRGDLQHLYPPHMKPDEGMMVTFNSTVPLRYLSEKDKRITLVCTASYDSAIGSKHSTILKNDLVLNIPNRSMTPRQVSMIDRIDYC